MPLVATIATVAGGGTITLETNAGGAITSIGPQLTHIDSLLVANGGSNYMFGSLSSLACAGGCTIAAGALTAAGTAAVLGAEAGR